jgi:hypothetical protein
MAIMKWGTPPSGTHHDRRASVVGHGDGVSVAHAAFGEQVGGSGAQDMSNPDVQLATKWSTAPYTGPPVDGDETPEPSNPWGYRSAKRANKCMANDDTCKAYAVDKYDKEYCNAHGRQATMKAQAELAAEVEQILDAE